MRNPTRLVLWLLCLPVAIGACAVQPAGDQAGESQADDAGAEPLSPPIGDPPTAVASATITGFVFPGDTVDLRGSASDPDETDAVPLVLDWVQTRGTTVDLMPTDNPGTVTFDVPDDVLPGETLGFSFRAVDADGNIASDPLYLFVPRTPGVVLANAIGPSEPVTAGDEVTMRSIGSLNIPADSAQYQWEIVDGPQVDLTGADEPTGRFIAPEPDDGRGELIMVIRLTLENLGVIDSQDVEVVVVAAP